MMKFNKKIIVSSLILATIAAPSAGLIMQSNDANVVQAATSNKKNTIKLISTNNNIKIPVYDRQGKQINGSTVESGANVTVIGKPIIVQQKYRKDVFEGIKINGKTYASLGDGGYIPINATGVITSKGMKITRDTAVYNKNGKKLSTYRGHTATLKKDSIVKYGGATTYTIPVSYFNIGNGRYVRASYVQEYSGQTVLTLNYNTFVYNKKGKRINYDGQRKLMNGGVVTTNSKIREAKSSDQNYFYSSANYTDKNKLAFTTTKIKGQDYLSIGKGGYIKIANVKTANGMILFTKGPITITLPSDTTIYSSNFKETKKQIAAGKKVILDKTEIDNSLSDPQLYFRIKGTNELIYWGDLGEYPGVDHTAVYDPNYYSIYSFPLRQFME